MIGVHITGGLGIPMGDPNELEGLSEEELAEVAYLAELFSGGSDYASYLSNRPQTLSYGFNDSPVAQLAYLVERFKEFDGWPINAEEVPLEPIHKDLLLTNATLYWFTETGASSSWTYYEGATGMPTNQMKAPTGVSHGEALYSGVLQKPKTTLSTGRIGKVAVIWLPWQIRNHLLRI